MILELTDMERRTLCASLAAYKKIKKAERMLTAHKEKTREDMEPIFTKYDVLINCVSTLEERLAT